MVVIATDNKNPRVNSEEQRGEGRVAGNYRKTVRRRQVLQCSAADKIKAHLFFYFLSRR